MQLRGREAHRAIMLLGCRRLFTRFVSGGRLNWNGGRASQTKGREERGVVRCKREATHCQRERRAGSRVAKRQGRVGIGTAGVGNSERAGIVGATWGGMTNQSG